MRRPSCFTLALTIVLVVSLYAAYSKLQKYSQWTPPTPAELAEVRMERIMQSVSSSLRDREECLRRDPSDACNRGMSTAQLVAFHSDLYDKMSIRPLYENPSDRNWWLGLGAVMAFLLYIRFVVAARARRTQQFRGGLARKESTHIAACVWHSAQRPLEREEREPEHCAPALMFALSIRMTHDRPSATVRPATTDGRVKRK